MAANGARPLQAAELRQLARAALRLAEQYTRHQTASIPPLPPPDACGNSNYVLLGRNVDGATEYFWSAASELQGSQEGGVLPPADDSGDAAYALQLHRRLNGGASRSRQETLTSLEDSDAALAWRLQQELNAEEGDIVLLSPSDSDDEGTTQLCAVCHTRPADKSSLHFSSRPTWCCKACSREQKSAVGVKSCEICTDEMRGIEFAQLRCGHSFCRTCMQHHVSVQLNQGSYPIRCPGGECKEGLTSRECFEFITNDKDHLRFSQMEVEQGIPLADRVYCPNESCSTLFMVPDDEGGTADGSAVCASCSYVFCVRCKTAWHGGVTCEEYKNNLEDADTLKLAAQENWRKCPHCGNVSGCLSCRAFHNLGCY